MIRRCPGVPPGSRQSGRRYLATDVGQFGCEYVDTGSAWIMPQGMVKLAEVTRGSTGLIGFASIPQGFKALRITGNIRSSRSGFGSTGTHCLPNGNTAALYQHVGADHTGAASPSSSGGSGETFGYAGVVAAAAATGGAFTAFEAEFPGYARSDCFKVVLTTTGGTTAGGVRRTDNVFEWTATNAVSAITIDDDVSGGFVAGSALALYGLV